MRRSTVLNLPILQTSSNNGEQEQMEKEEEIEEKKKRTISIEFDQESFEATICTSICVTFDNFCVCSMCFFFRQSAPTTRTIATEK